jgi:hypothetical protein
MNGPALAICSAQGPEAGHDACRNRLSYLGGMRVKGWI